MPGKPKDYTGTKVGKLTYIRPTDQRSGKKIVWETLCECGNVYYSGDYRRKSCGCGRTEASYSGRKYSPRISSARRVWTSHYRDSRFDTFLRMSQEPCFYCGSVPIRTYNAANERRHDSQRQRSEGDFTYNGLDRIDNSKGHTDDNVVPCCTRCNKAKMDMTLNEFLTHIVLMYEHTRSLRQKT